jgi:hypothetical protein
MKRIHRVHSEDDLTRAQEEESTSSTDPEMLIRWAINVDENRTWFTAKQGTAIPAILDETAARMGIARHNWRVVNMTRGLHETTIYCTARSPEERHAVIHFGNQAWTGRVNASWTPAALVNEAQKQLKFVGTWKVRKNSMEDGVLEVEAEEVEEALDYPILERDEEVRIDFEGSVLTRQMKAGDGRWEQGRHTQEAFKQTLLC